MTARFFADTNVAVYTRDVDATKRQQVLAAGCAILYSEDMQNGQVFDGRLTVNNPF